MSNNHTDTEDEDEIKYCPVCKNYLPVYFFNKNKLKPDGYNSRCRDCAKQYRDKKGAQYKKQNENNPIYIII